MSASQSSATRAMARTNTDSPFLPFFVCCSLLLLGNGVLGLRAGWRRPARCRLEQLQALDPATVVESEAGTTEYWDQDSEQMTCLGIFAKRTTVRRRGLLLPTYNSAPAIIYVTEGSAIFGMIVADCPETVVRVERGEVLAVPAGTPHWLFNDGDSQLVAITFLDMTSPSNKLDWNYREFLLAGKHFTNVPPDSARVSTNLFSGYDLNTVAFLLAIEKELAEKIQSKDDKRGHIVTVEGEFNVQISNNSVAATSCPSSINFNIDHPENADVYTPGGGRITNLYSDRLPILKSIQLNAVRGIVFKNAIVSIHWQVNDHSLMYCTEGSGRIEIVNHLGHKVFDNILKPGQLLILPQFHGVVKHAGNEGLNWTSIKSNDPSIISVTVGTKSVLRSLSEDVIMHSYKVSRDEAKIIKNSRGDHRTVFPPPEEENFASA